LVEVIGHGEPLRAGLFSGFGRGGECGRQRLNPAGHVEIDEMQTDFHMPSCLTHPTSGCIRQPPLEGEVCGYTGEALAVFSRTSTATEVGATI